MDPSNIVVPSKKLTESERIGLMQKLDDELEQFMEEMSAKKLLKEEDVPKKPFDFDEWCKEIDQHPCFMNENSDISSCLNGKYGDTVAALQAMKYEEESKEDKHFTAEKYKNEGNKHFQLKKYRWATDCYTSGIKAMCDDKKLNAILYCNRAAAQKSIGNLRTAIKDCSMARKFDPTNLKGVNRGAECLIELGYPSDALKWIETSKNLFAVHKETEEEGKVTDAESKLLDTMEAIRIKAVEASVVAERNVRKQRLEKRKEDDAKAKLLGALEERKMNFKPKLPFQKPEMMDWSLLTVSLPQLHDHQIVSFDTDGNLQWPLLLQYPEAGQIDVLTECNETTHMGELLRHVLENPAEWDKEQKFSFGNVRFFVPSEWDEYLIEVFEWMDFRTIFSTPGMQIRQGLPVLMIFTASHVEKSFVQGEDAANRFTVV